MNKPFKIIFTSLFIFLCHTVCYAALIDRDYGLIYDDVQNLTWLQDANYANSTGYDDALYGYNTNGGLTYEDALSWADTLEYSDPRTGIVYNDWRLPKTFLEEGGWHAGSEMGSLYYIGLNNVANDLSPNMSPFINVQPYWYRSSTEFVDPTFDWAFRFKGGSDDWTVSGYQATADRRVPEAFAWAVRDGDIVLNAVPEPPPFLLFSLGLIGAGLLKKKINSRMAFMIKYKLLVVNNKGGILK